MLICCILPFLWPVKVRNDNRTFCFCSICCKMKCVLIMQSLHCAHAPRLPALSQCVHIGHITAALSAGGSPPARPISPSAGETPHLWVIKGSLSLFPSFLYSISPSLLYHILLLYRRRWEIYASLHPHGHDSTCPSLYRGCGNFLFSCVTPTAPSIWLNNHSSWNMLMLSLMLFKWPLLQ